MRCYHLNNFYLGGIHAGIQSAHAQHELMLKYVDPSNPTIKSPYAAPQIQTYLDWARDHKTIIVLNAGAQKELQSWVEFLTPLTHPYAWAQFHEEEGALNGALTNVALVLPERIYNYARTVTRARDDQNSAVRIVKRFDDGAECRYYNTDAGGKLVAPDGGELLFTTFELDLMSRLSKCGLM